MLPIENICRTLNIRLVTEPKKSTANGKISGIYARTAAADGGCPAAESAFFVPAFAKTRFRMYIKLLLCQ